MTGAADPRLTHWQTYYEIVGSSAAALIGIQFVVITLIASLRRSAKAETVSAFGTPTVVHLAVALIVSTIMSAPWPLLLPVSIAIGVCGFGGVAYIAVVIHRARRQTGYQPVWEDWLWHAALPCTAYAVLAASAVLLNISAIPALFVIAAAALGILLIGIHNAWDSVTHIAVTGSGDNEIQTK